jgi:gamma-glutamyltranspeptidase/glutathione hydrolase
MHTLNPVLLRRDGQAHMVLGTPGGPSQVYTNSILLLRLVEQGDDVQRALDAPRWFRTPAGEIMIESSVPASVRDELLARGHRVVVHPPHTVAMGGAGIVRRLSNGVRQAGADPRRESYAVAY